MPNGLVRRCRRSLRPRAAARRIAVAVVCALLLAATLVQGARAHVVPGHGAPPPAHAALHDRVVAETDGVAGSDERQAAPDANAAFFAHCPLCAPVPLAVAIPPLSSTETRASLDSRRTGLAPEPAKRPPRA